MDPPVSQQAKEETRIKFVSLKSGLAKEKKVRKPSKSLFTFGNGQSISTQLDDTIFVLRRMMQTRKNSSAPSQFTKRYILNPVFRNDLFVISFGLPALSATPRVLDAAPTTRSNASDWTYHGGRTATARESLLNVASYNYLGFVDLEFNTRNVLEHALRQLPFADDERNCNRNLEDAMKSELRNFMGMKGCVLTPTGYSINLVAFPAMAASSGSAETVFLMDSESHSSMFMGAFIACSGGKGRVVKFRHNDVQDLMTKLERVCSTGSEEFMENVWVAIEGMYSMDGTVPPLPEIVALKRKYGFHIYIDEAHSFLAIGNTGQGVVEYFGYCDTTGEGRVRMDDIDMLGGTISKSMSSVGGFVLSSATLAGHLETRTSDMRASNGSSIPTLSLIRTLQIIKKPTLVTQRLAHLRSLSAYAITILEAKGYLISATRGGPLIAIIVDTVDRVLEFLRVGRQVGLICCGAAFPAAPRGAPRVRLSLTAAHTWAEIDEILLTIDQIATTVGVKGLDLSKGLSTLNAALQKESLVSSPSEELDPTTFSDTVDASILALCPPIIDAQNPEEKCIRAAGLTALERYNLGASGPRWMYGTFSAHMTLEERITTALTSVIDSVVAFSPTAEPIQTSLITDTRIGIMSIIANCMEGLTVRRSKKGEKHLVLLPEAAGLEIREGFAAAQPDRSVKTRWYDISDGKNDLRNILRDEYLPSAKKTHLTLYIDHSLTPPLPDLPILTIKPPFSLTLILNDPSIFTSSLSSTRSLITALKPLLSAPTTRFLVFGSFHTMPHLPGLQGAFCTGSKHLIEKVQFLGQGIMYTAMMPPVTAALAEESFRGLVQSAGL